MADMYYEPDLQEFIKASDGLRVLVVDDSKSIRDAIRERLELGGLTVIDADCGKAGLDEIYKSPPDLVLMDVVMPGMDGVSVLRTLRKAYSKIKLPVILVTSLDSSSEIVNALDYGANDYVTKPIDFDVLWARIGNQLIQKQAAEYLHNAQSSLELQIKQRTAELNSSNKKLRQEINERLLAENKLQIQANYDELTGLPNRNLASDRLADTLKKAKRRNTMPCVAFVDLDNFKYVNDTLGHAAGDELLREASRRLQSCLRESDTVARLGGDEFLLILDDDTASGDLHESGVRRVGDRIVKHFSEPFYLEGHEINVTASMGFAFYPKDGEDSNKLMCHADAAMYRSKHDGKNTFCFYSPEMTDRVKTRMNIELRLRYALQKKEFMLQYQPIVNSATGRIVKAEALLRWNSPELGPVQPDKFIPIAEDTGQIVSIGEWVIKSACRQVKAWRDAGLRHMCVTVNVSARQFQNDSNLAHIVRTSLETNGLSSDALQLELTEGVLMHETAMIRETMELLEKTGVKLLIDDFGTGYASLSYLQRYNFDSIKIDRSYINNVLTNPADAKLVRAIIALASSLGLQVISEGVENEGQLKFLLEANCQFAQGYYFSRPVSAEDFTSLFKGSYTSLAIVRAPGRATS
jgi:diguanylate cyclase (GGDEF)-like protein